MVIRSSDAARGHEMLRRTTPHFASADAWGDLDHHLESLGIGIKCEGLKALRLPSDTLETYPEELREGIAARAPILNDDGANAPTNWEYPFGSFDAHVLVTIIARNPADLAKVLDQAQQTCGDVPDKTIIKTWSTAAFRRDKTPSGSRMACTIPT